MSTLSDRIMEMVEVQRALGAMALEARTDPNRRADVLKLRKQSAEAVRLVISAIDEDSQLQADPDLARQFRHEFSSMGARIAVFQAKWPAALLSQDNDEFTSDREKLRGQNNPVTDWALRVLR